MISFPNYTVDLDFKSNLKISRQHALILYNFKNKKFEIKCLSQKYPIKVNNIQYRIDDGPVELDNLTNIMIGNISFYFLLPKNNE